MNSKTYIHKIADEFGGLRKDELLNMLERLRKMINEEPLEIKVREKTKIESITEFKESIKEKAIIKKLATEEKLEIIETLKPKKVITIEDILRSREVNYQKCIQIIDVVRKSETWEKIDVFGTGDLFYQFWAIAEVNKNIIFDDDFQNFKVQKNGDKLE